MIPVRVKWATFAIICIAIAFTYFLKINFKLDTSDTIAVAGLIFTILAFTAVLYSLYAVFAQLRKSMAKPLIKVAFNEKGEQSFTLTYKDNLPTNNLPILWLINEGNAITRYFQIDLIIPESVAKTSAYNMVKNNGNYIFSYINDADHTLFVKRPQKFQNLNLSTLIDDHKCIKSSEKSFLLKYRIYGDWAETQKGELTLRIQEATGGS